MSIPHRLTHRARSCPRDAVGLGDGQTRGSRGPRLTPIFQRLALSPDELRPGGHRHSRRSCRSWARGLATSRSSASRCSRRGRTPIRRLRPHVLPAERRAALLLLVHRRLHRDGVSLAHQRGTGAVRSDDHRLQSGGHVRRRSHPPRLANIPRRVHRHRRVQHPQGIRLRRRLPAKPPA